MRIKPACFLLYNLTTQVRWTKSVGSLDDHSKGLVGNTLISAAAIAYIGAFTPSYRRDLLSYWLQLCQTYSINVSENFELTEFLVEPIEIQRWLNYSLPYDKHSIEVTFSLDIHFILLFLVFGFCVIHCRI